MRLSTLLVIFVFVSLCVVLSCSRRATNNEVAQAATTQQTGLTDEALMALVKKFASGSENEPAVFQELARYPQTEIVERLRRLQGAAPVDSFDKVAIAFLLCNLNHEVEANKTVIVTALAQEPHARNLYADWDSDLIARLIKKGHKDLLPVLFSAAAWADGAMSEALSGFFADQVHAAPQEFVLQLSKQPAAIRKSVYADLRYAGLTTADLNDFKKYANSITDPNLKAVAREILAAIGKGDG
jgi:hypothetical protein